jgi:ribosome-binding protein aMBF1 (putative translation factor)
MNDERVKDEFTRMELASRLNRDREIINQYEAGLAFHRQRVEDTRYELGRLDERLGGQQ